MACKLLALLGRLFFNASLADFPPLESICVESKQATNFFYMIYLFILLCISQDKPLTRHGKRTVPYL